MGWDDQFNKTEKREKKEENLPGREAAHPIAYRDERSYPSSGR